MTGVPNAALETSRITHSKKRIQSARGTFISLDKQGFELVTHNTQVGDFNDAQEVRAKYYREMEELVLRHTGAERAVLFDHTIRKVEKPTTAAGEVRTGGVAPRGGHTTRAVNKVHGDYTSAGVPRRIRALAQPGWADDGGGVLHSAFDDPQKCIA